MNNFFDEGFCVPWNQIGKQYEEGQSSSHTMSASEYETRLAEYNLQLIADTLDISRQQSGERVKESLKKAFDLSDNIFHMRQGIRKKYLEYEFRYVQQLRSHFPDSLSGVRSENDEEYTRILILYQLVLGNISLCLNEICLEYFIYDEADKWFQLALDAFWQAKGLNYGLEDKLHEDEEIYVYKYLIMLNIGKCYHNYAMQHQKSDYYAAQERFDQIISETQDQKGQLCRIMRRENDRRLKLIIMDAYAFELRIKRQERSFYQDCDSVKANERHQSYKDYEEKLEMMRKYCDKHFLNDSNRYKQYTAQISIEEAIINRKRRCFDAALEKAAVVEEKRNQDSLFAWEAPPHNTDAINNISSVFRGIISSGDQPDLHIQSLNITYSIDCYPDRKPKNETDPTEICYFYKKEQGRAPLQSKLIALLRMLAREGNMYALREYVHWYGQYLKKPTEAAKLILLGDSFCTERPEVNALRTLTTSDAITRLGRGLDYILKNDEAVYRNAKGHHVYSLDDIERLFGVLIQRFPVDLAQDSACGYDDKVIPKDNSERNLALQYLKCVFFSRIGSYSRIDAMLRALCARKEFEYISKGTLGLKVRYMLAKSYMAAGEFKNALNVLTEIRDALQRKENHIFERTDIRTELMYGKCLVCLGLYTNAKEEVYAKGTPLYIRIHASTGNSAEKVETEYRPESKHRMNRFYLDAMLCALHMYDKAWFDELMKDISEMPNAAFIGEMTDWRDQLDSSIIQGYGKVFWDEKNGYKEGLPYFLNAYAILQKHIPYDDPVYEVDRQSILRISDRVKELKDVECRSAYIITLIILWQQCNARLSNELIHMRYSGLYMHDEKNNEDIHTIQDKIIRFIIDTPVSNPVTMQAAFLIADWIAQYEYMPTVFSTENISARLTDADLPQINSAKDKHEANVRRLYQSFSKCSLYPEQGSGAFESLKKSVEFLYYPSEDQGRILVALMKLYRPIQRIKNCCRLTTEELGGKRVAQYTSLNTLKALLHEPADGENPPRFRASSSGFMNDLFEGDVFLKLLFQNAPSEIAANLKNCHELTRDWQNSNVHIVKNNIYIASFVKDEPDTSGAFNMWNIYGDAENGCILQFDNSFFDIRNSTKNKKPVEQYFISGDTDADYPLYAIEYVQREKERCTLENGEQEDAIQEALKELSMQLASFHDVQRSIQNRESEGESTDMQPRANVRKKKAEQCISSFVSDRLNEIRYLFKDQNYRYENEIRAVISSGDYKVYERNGRNGQSTQITYVEIDRPIERMDVVLGGKIDPIDVQHLTTWMRQTGRVIRITQSKINRE